MAKVVVLSGAGISAESGISTFRSSDGLWEEYDVKKICTAGCLIDNREETIEFYDKRRADLEDKKPNKAHITLANLKKKYKDDIAIITQNVDDLFEKAGVESDELIHLHGLLTKVECESCGFIYDIGYEKISNKFNGKCPNCHSEKIRPYIVMFGEQAPMYDELYSHIGDCELLVVIGTSGNVINVDSFATSVKKSILNNLEPSEAIFDKLYSKVLYKKATEAIDEIALDIDRLLEDRVTSLTNSLISATVHIRNYDLDGLTFDSSNANSLYNYLIKIIQKDSNLTKDEFDRTMTNLIVEFKDRRDNRLSKNEKAEDYSRLICFFVNGFDFDLIFRKNKF